MTYTSPTVGNNILFTFSGLDGKYFSNPSEVERIMRLGLERDGLTVLKWHLEVFGPNAYTFTAPLSESHASGHTYQEHDSINLGVYSCLGPESGMRTYETCLVEMKPSKEVTLFRNPVPITPEATRDLEENFKLKPTIEILKGQDLIDKIKQLEYKYSRLEARR